MFKTLHAHLRHNVVGYIAVFIALGGTTYATTGGNFILGQANTAGSPTTLSSSVTGPTGAFKVTNTKTGRAITAVGASGGYGVWASGGQVSRNTAAIHGQSTGGNAIEGISGSTVASGVYGQNDSTGFGVAGRSTNGTGVMGDSTAGWAFQASGNTTQTRAGAGFVKAMAYVDFGNHPSDPIQQCFNSQLPPAQATSGDCGFTISSSVTHPTIDFGFKVDDRFVSVTTHFCDCAAGVSSPGPNSWTVTTFDTSTQVEVGTGFYIFVY